MKQKKRKEKNEKKEEGKFRVFDHILHEEEEVGRRKKLSRGHDVKECCIVVYRAAVGTN